METRSYDVIIIGGTSFVGCRFIRHFQDYFLRNDLKVMVTARNLSKLGREFPENSFFTFQKLELTDEEAVHGIVRQGKIVVNFAGPFDLYGEYVVAACAQYGAHYLDITGEVYFAKRMIERYFAKAAASGAKIVPFCGFDSIPADYSVFYAREQMKERGENLSSLDLVFHLRSGFNGGTIATGKDMAQKQTSLDNKNRHYLVANRNAFLQEDADKPRFIKETKTWVSPILMEPINSKIVYRSLHLNDLSGVSEPFHYRESFHIGKNFLTNWLGTKGLLVLNMFFKYKLTCFILDLFLPKPGEGPSEDSIINGFFKAKTFARSDKGTTLSFSLSSQGDPSNRSTIKMIGSCMKCLLNEKGTEHVGVITPSHAFGHDLISFLEKEGVQFSDVKQIS